MMKILDMPLILLNTVKIVQMDMMVVGGLLIVVQFILMDIMILLKLILLHQNLFSILELDYRQLVVTPILH